MEALLTNITATCPLAFAGTTGQLFARAVVAVVASHCAIFNDYQWPRDHAPEILKSGQYIFLCLICFLSNFKLKFNISSYFVDYKYII
jgi:hypothetical protein